MNQNPYAAPQSRVVTASMPGAGLLEQPLALPSSAAFDWLRKGWRMFLLAPGIWVLMALLAGLGYAFFVMIPFGGLVVQALMPIVLAGFYVGADRLNFGESLDLAQISAGFSRHPGPLALVGVISGLVQFAIMLPLAFGLIAIGEGYGDGNGLFANGDALFVTMLVAIVAMTLVLFLVSLLTWFAPLLIAIDHQDLIQALRLGFRGCRRNVAPILLLATVTISVLLGLLLTLGLGYLVVLPWYCCVSYVAYRQIFFGD
ncbi:hypothetical protein C7S18_12065 [Ahniella affigens]|uniref:DUF2189 domain-containing protein n=1 Tax=Ahniella affigens TaxID=2021234 RepID=A0A2P1PSR4_9GAMM|nr:BPSS1780 family membrane protein [Ahniella affigens]AVP97887.1 hypothetical protein C7S18_12065 [Ahniella affigens]